MTPDLIDIDPDEVEVLLGYELIERADARADRLVLHLADGRQVVVEAADLSALHFSRTLRGDS